MEIFSSQQGEKSKKGVVFRNDSFCGLGSDDDDDSAGGGGWKSYRKILKQTIRVLFTLSDYSLCFW